MGMINVSKEELAQVQQPSEGWQPLEVTKTSWEPSKKGDGSKVLHVSFRVFRGDDEGKGIKAYYSEKLMGTIGELLDALGFDANPDGSYNIADDSVLVKRKCEGNIVPGEYQGKPTKSIAAFRRLSS